MQARWSNFFLHRWQTEIMRETRQLKRGFMSVPAAVYRTQKPQSSDYYKCIEDLLIAEKRIAFPIERIPRTHLFHDHWCRAPHFMAIILC